MDKLEELLPGIEKYLTEVLAAESLSSSAEKQRQYYAERLDVLKLAFPPTLPPRNDNVSDEYIAQQRELARLRGGTLPPPQEFDDQEEYDAVEDPVTMTTVTAPLTTEEDDDLYEEPVLPNTDNTSSKYDEFSDTSYESYDDEEDSGAVYINNDFHGSRDPELPRDDSCNDCERSKKKKKKDKEEKEGVQARSLPNTTFSGDLYQKVKWSWSKRFCVVTEGRLLTFKGEKDTKVSSEFPLDGYDVLYLEKEAKRNHVMRISRPGSETFWYSADTKEKVDQWLEILNAACSGGSGGSVTTSGFNSAASGSPRIDKDADSNVAPSTDAVKRSSSLTDLSMTSDGSSGDGTIGQTSSLERSDSDSKKVSKGERKSSKPLLDSLSTFFGTFGKKKGEKARKAVLAEMEEDADPDALISGYLNVCSDLMTNKKWNRRWCVVKTGMLACFKELGDEDCEFCFPLSGCDVVSACDPKRKLAIRIIEEGKEKMILDMPETMMQGQWLTVLIKETGCAEKQSGYSYASPDGNQINEDDDIYDEVIEDRSILGMWKLPSDFSFTSNSTDLLTKQQVDKESDENKKPPPLPNAPPPGVALSKYLKTDKSKQQQQRAQRRTSIKRPTEAPPSVPVQKKTDAGKASMTPSASSKQLTEEELKEVVKCHQGPTIEEDRELLQCTQNPILSELRQRRTVPTKVVTPVTAPTVNRSSWKLSESERVNEQISEVKKRLATIKKKRAEIRSQKLGSTDIDERVRLDDKLRDMLKEQDAAEADLSKLMLKHADLVAKERKASLERDSLARRESLSKLERKDSLSKLEKRDSFSSKLEKKDSISRKEVGEWDIISKKASMGEFEQGSDKKSFGSTTTTKTTTTTTTQKYGSGSSPRSNGSNSPLTSQGRLTSAVGDRKAGTRQVDTKNGISSHGTGRYRDQLSKYASESLTDSSTSRTTTTSSSSSLSGARGLTSGTQGKQRSNAIKWSGPRGYEKRSDSPESGSSSPRGQRKPVKEKLKLWEDISSSTC